MLAAFGLEFHPVHKVLICTECGRSIRPVGVQSHVDDHLKRANDGLTTRVRKEADTVKLPALLEFSRDAGVSEGYEAFAPPTPNGPPVEGLKVCVGHRCAFDGCDFASAGQRTVSNHFGKKHKDARDAKVRSIPTHVQTFFAQPALRYFSVNPDLCEEDRDRETARRYSLLITDHIPNLAEENLLAPKAQRDRSPVCRATDWDELLIEVRATDASRTAALNLIRVPDKSTEKELYNLIVAMEAYTSEIEILTTTVPRTALRLLKKAPVL